MAMFKSKTEEERAAAEERKRTENAAREQQRARDQAGKQRQRYLSTAVGKAETAFDRGDHLFQYEHSLMSQEAVIVAMVGSSTRKETADPSEILNAVSRRGWELVNGSFIFVVQGEQKPGQVHGLGTERRSEGADGGLLPLPSLPGKPAGLTVKAAVVCQSAVGSRA